MEKDFEKKYHDLEKNHFWFKARRKYITDLLKDYPRDANILDIGCSSGILLNELIEMGFDRNKMYGIDISEEAIANCKTNNIHNSFVMDAQNISLPKKFDILIASDCLEHLENDRKAMKNWKDLLTPDGVLLVFVPAFMSLWSDHDVANMHFRRYTRPELKEKLRSEGFKILKSSYWNFFLFPPIFLVRYLSKKGKPVKNGDLDKTPPLNGLLYNLINIENQLLRLINFPIGVSTFCIVKKEHQ